MDRARDVVEARLESVNVEKVVEQALESAGNSSGTAPASSALIPEGSHLLN